MRLKYYQINPPPSKELYGINQHLDIDPKLRAMLEIRISQINGFIVL